MGLRSFFGIIPPRIPYTTTNAAVESLSVVDTVTLLAPDAMRAGLGVAVGSEVVTGQNLVRPGQGVLVSTVTGTVTDIGSFTDAAGVAHAAIHVDARSPDLFDPSIEAIDDFAAAAPEDLAAALGRAGFPMFDRLADGMTIETLIVSALDPSPHAIVNQQALRDHADEMPEAVAMLALATGAKRVKLAVPSNLSTNATRFTEIVTVPAEYPRGLPEILARREGGGHLFRKVGTGVVGDTLVCGTEQLLEMAACLRLGRALTDKTVTCFDASGGRYRNVKTRIGTPIAAILRHVGAELPKAGKLIVNGPMRGYACFSDEQPVTAATDSIMLQERAEVFTFENNACTNCGKCSAICPVGLEVNLLGRYAEYGCFEECMKFGVENCIDCGLCAYVCPARRPLVQLISHARLTVRTAPPKEVSYEEAAACKACGPCCPALRIWDDRAGAADQAADEEVVRR